ncbi:MAG TPA: tripartite tricarboxylate transporter substrate binding protein [Steroidobacteraceae bacterium]
MIRRPIRSFQRMGRPPLSNVANQVQDNRTVQLRQLDAWCGMCSPLMRALTARETNMIVRRSWLMAVAAACSVFATAPLSAQSYPQHPVRIIIDRPAGVPHDLVTRALADKLSATFKQTVIVDNRVGAGGNLAAEFVARSAPDGYTLLVALDTTLTVNPTLYKKLSFNPQADLRPLSILASSSQMLVVHPSVPVNSVAEFVAYAKANPVSYAHGGNGSPGHLTMELFRMMAGFPATPVPYRGNAQLAIDLAAGQIKFGFVGIGGVIEHIRAGRLKALAISSAERSPLVPDIPTIAEAGYDFQRQTYFVLLAPAATPEPVASFIEREVRNALQAPDLIDRFGKLNIEIAGSSGAEARARLETDAKLWVKVIKDTGMQVN